MRRACIVAVVTALAAACASFEPSSDAPDTVADAGTPDDASAAVVDATPPQDDAAAPPVEAAVPPADAAPDVAVTYFCEDAGAGTYSFCADFDEGVAPAWSAIANLRGGASAIVSDESKSPSSSFVFDTLDSGVLELDDDASAGQSTIAIVRKTLSPGRLAFVGAIDVHVDVVDPEPARSIALVSVKMEGVPVVELDLEGAGSASTVNAVAFYSDTLGTHDLQLGTVSAGVWTHIAFSAVIGIDGGAPDVDAGCGAFALELTGQPNVFQIFCGSAPEPGLVTLGIVTKARGGRWRVHVDNVQLSAP